MCQHDLPEPCSPHGAALELDLPEDLPRHATNRRFDRRALLRRVGTGGVLAVTGTSLFDELAAAVAPPFEGRAMGEEVRPAFTAPAAAPAAAAPAAAPVARSGIATPRIITRAEWGANEKWRTPVAFGYAPIRKLVVHHTASRNKPSDPAQVVRDMYHYHVKERGFSDLGYNFVIDHRGAIYEGRRARRYGQGEVHSGEDVDGYGVIGAHALGVNAGSCGIVLIGDFTRAKPTDAAVGALIQLLSWKAARHQIDPTESDEYISVAGASREFRNIIGHMGVGETLCPGGYLADSMGWVRSQVERRVGHFASRTINMAKVTRWAGDSSSGATGGDTSASTGSNSAGADSSSTTSSGSSGGAATWGGTLVGYRILFADGRIVTLGSKARKHGQPRDKGLAGTAISGIPGSSAFLSVDPSGRVAGFGGAGSTGEPGDVSPVDIAAKPGGDGYWVLTSNGGVYAYGNARHVGSFPRSGISRVARALRPTPTGKGYWILSSAGSVHAFGDARALKSPGVGDAVDLWPTPTGAGYWVLLADGRVFAYGDAPQRGGLPDLGTKWKAPAVALVGMPSGRGYVVCSADGGLFSFGSAPFFGSLGGSGRQAVGLAPAFA
jgi:hypothetical protein